MSETTTTSTTTPNNNNNTGVFPKPLVVRWTLPSGASSDHCARGALHGDGLDASSSSGGKHCVLLVWRRGSACRRNVQHLCLRLLDHRNGLSGTPWSRSWTSCPWCRSSTPPCRRWGPLSRFPWFTVVVTFFIEILYDFHAFVSECVFFQKKINNQFWGSHGFSLELTIFIGRETKTHILQTKTNEKNVAKVSSSNKNYSFRI